MKTKQSIRTIFSGFLTAVMLIGTLPSITVNAAQINEYVDPADTWITSNGRSNELDFGPMSILWTKKVEILC